MSKDVTRNPTNSGAGGGNGRVSKRLLEMLEHEELLEVLSEGFCKHCASTLETRIFNLVCDKLDDISLSTDNTEVLSSDHSRASAARSQNDSESMRKWPHQGERILCLSLFSVEIREPDQSFRREGFDACSSPASLNRKQHSLKHSDYEMLLNDGLGGVSSTADNGLLEEQKEQFRFLQVGRKKDFVHVERIDGKAINVLRGLELHTKVFKPHGS